MNEKKKKAFTLTELLVVVLILGVLSAVALPKFNRVIETRKVTEAEEIMAAVRTEQEKRCALDQYYVQNFSKLSNIIASNDTNNFSYNISDDSLQGQGIAAASKSSDYTLKMLSYADGRICCEGEGCTKLNKNYPDCSAVTVPVSVCVDPASAPEEPSCPATKPADAVKNCECGTVTASHYCDASTGYAWVQQAFPACNTRPSADTETCSPCGDTRTRSYSCVSGAWQAGAWSASCKTAAQCHTCGPEYDMAKSLCVNGGGFGPKGTWIESSCACDCGRDAQEDREGCVCYDDLEWNGTACVERSQCNNAAYAAAHKCECEPSAYYCCTQDWADIIREYGDSVYNQQTRQCSCPAGLNLYQNPDSYWACLCPNPASNKAQCCPNEPRTNTVCWIKNPEPSAIWKLLKVTASRDCQGLTGTCDRVFTEGTACDSPGRTCTVESCGYTGGGSDWGDQYTGDTYTYKCTSTGQGSYLPNGW